MSSPRSATAVATSTCNSSFASINPSKHTGVFPRRKSSRASCLCPCSLSPWMVTVGMPAWQMMPPNWKLHRLPHLFESDDSLVDEVGESAECADDDRGAPAEILLLHGDGRASVADAHAHDRAERELPRLVVDLLHQFAGRNEIVHSFHPFLFPFPLINSPGGSDGFARIAEVLRLKKGAHDGQQEGGRLARSGLRAGHQAQFLERPDGLVLVGGAAVSLVLDLRVEELLEEGARVDVLLEQLGFGRFGWDEGRRHRLERERHPLPDCCRCPPSSSPNAWPPLWNPPDRLPPPNPVFPLPQPPDLSELPKPVEVPPVPKPPDEGPPPKPVEAVLLKPRPNPCELPPKPEIWASIGIVENVQMPFRT
ncbi:hypothetical protein WR25_13714 [Diploscapter pachys]|uniref:Uncharacterized protein n=1 Tax=Diploscapter pachys TaxID=2018661 RepID=A0A2A2J6K9_9BILA|nr:hypothetical protein WR25_13714 [Diploscapter pachys]